MLLRESAGERDGVMACLRVQRSVFLGGVYGRVCPPP